LAKEVKVQNLFRALLCALPLAIAYPNVGIADTITVAPVYVDPDRQCEGDGCNVRQQPEIVCEGQNCLPQQDNPVVTCEGQNCMRPSENRVETCEGVGCTPEPND
jgi:hypothetical protein